MSEPSRPPKKHSRFVKECVILFSVLVSLFVGFLLFNLFVLDYDGNEMLFAYVYSYDPYKVPSKIDEAWMIGKTSEEINERYDSMIIFQYHRDRYFVYVYPVYEDGVCVKTGRDIGPAGG